MTIVNRLHLSADWKTEGGFSANFVQPDNTSWTDLSEQPEGGLVPKTVGVLENVTDEQMQVLMESKSVDIFYVEKYDNEDREKPVDKGKKEVVLSEKEYGDLKKELPELEEIVLEKVTPEEIIKVLKEKWKEESELAKSEKEIEVLEPLDEPIIIKGKVN